MLRDGVEVEGVEVEGQRVSRSPATRHYRRPEIARLHEDAGFIDVGWLSGFTLDPPSQTDCVVTTLARRPERPASSSAGRSAADR